jgi:hypothetical protein
MQSKGLKNAWACLQPNPELEAEWSELQDLGEQYRKLEKHILRTSRPHGTG